MVNNFNNIEKKPTIEREEKATTYGVGNPGPGLVQVHKCGGVKSTLFSLLITFLKT